LRADHVVRNAVALATPAPTAANRTWSGRGFAGRSAHLRRVAERDAPRRTVSHETGPTIYRGRPMVLSVCRSLVERDGGAVSPHTHLGLRCRERRPISTTGTPSPDRIDAKAARRTAPDVDTLLRPAGPARLPESRADERTPTEGGGRATMTQIGTAAGSTTRAGIPTPRRACSRPATPRVGELEDPPNIGVPPTARCCGAAGIVRRTACACAHRRQGASPPLRGASGPDAGSAHARPGWLLLTMPAHTTPTCCGRPSAQNRSV